MPANLLIPLVVGVLSQVAAPGAQPAAQPVKDALAGPRVDTDHERATLVERDFNGLLRRPETTVEEAAVKLLDLDMDAKAKVDKVLADHALIIEQLVEHNLDLLIRLNTADGASNKEKFLLVMEAIQKAEPLRKERPLAQQFRDVLPKDQAREFDRLTKDYWDAIVDEDKHNPKPKGRLGAIMDVRFQALGKEIEAAFKRAERSGGVLYYYLFGKMTLTDDQSRQLKTLCAQYSMNGLDVQDKKLQGAFFISAMQILDKEQKVELARRLKGK